MAWLTNVVLEERELREQRMELTDKGSLYFLGPNLTLEKCHLVLKVSARNLLIRRGTRFIDCHFEVKQELKNHQDWVFASLENCRFQGRFSGCDFGSWPGYAEGSEFGSITDCDFTQAQLNGCRFMGCDPRTLQLPRWPCFTILHPLQNASALRGVQWPGLFGGVVVEDLPHEPPSTVATTFHAPTVARRLETTPEALQAVLETFDFILH
jgi:uncharacterized protein YjbI with pentapeptide repeats